MSDKIRKLLKDKRYLAQQEKVALRGENGKDGRDGRDGKDGETIIQEVIREVIKEQPIIKTEIIKEVIKDNPINGEDGEDGISITSAKVDSRGDLIITYSDGKVQNAGHVRGQDGRSTGGSGAALKTIQAEYVPYIGAKQDIDLGSNNLITTGQIVNRNLQASLSCGVHEGLAVTINADPTKIDIASGSYTIIDDWTDPQNPVEYNIQHAGLTGVIVENLATSNFSYIALDDTGAVVQYSEKPTGSEHRGTVTLAQLGHTNRTSVVSVNEIPEVFASPIEQFRDLLDFLGVVNEDNIISPNGANLSINKSTGRLFFQGSNFYNDRTDPHVVTIEAYTPATFRRRTQTGLGATGVTTIDPANYDDGGTITALSGTKYTNQRVFLFPNGNMVIQYGQTQYNNLAQAIAAIPTETFVLVPNVEGLAAYIAVISVRNTATALNDPAQCIITPIDANTGFPAGSSGTSTATLQQVYENSSPNPEIQTTSTSGAVTLRTYSGGDATNALEVQDNAGTTNFSVRGDGLTTVGNNLNTSASRSGSAVTNTVSNTSATANSDARMGASTAISGGSPKHTLAQGVNAWSQGIDASDGLFKRQWSITSFATPYEIVTQSGVITRPLQPDFLAYKSTSSANATGDATAVTVVCDTELYDQDGSYDNTTGIFTAPENGKYLFEGFIEYTNIGASHNACVISLVTSGGIYNILEINPTAVRIGGQYFGITFSTAVLMSAGDTAYVRTAVSGSTKTVSIYGQASSPFYTRFSGRKVN